MYTIQFLLSNPLLNMAFLSWLTAQLLKTVFDWAINNTFRMERMIGSGGMPSSHSALVVSLAVGMARIEGYTSASFALALALAAVVMYDAMGIRRAAGEQAKVLNKMVFDFHDLFENLSKQLIMDFDEGDEQDDEQDPKRALKEYLGHTPLEVLAGSLLGTLIAVAYPL